MVERQSNIVYVCVYALVLGIHRYINTHTHTHARTHSISSGLCVCERAGVICFMMRRATCYTLTTIARSITWIFLSLNRHVDDREREREKENERFNFSIRDEHGLCSAGLYICFSFLLSLSLSLSLILFSNRRSRCAFFSHFVSFRSSSSAILFLSSICSSLNVPTVNNLIQCVAVDGQIGFVSHTDVEPLHIVSIAKPLTTPTTPSTMSNFFHRKTGEHLGFVSERCHVLLVVDAKKNLMKTKARQLSKDMIGLPQADFIHAFHIGVSGQRGEGGMDQWHKAISCRWNVWWCRLPCRGGENRSIEDLHGKEPLDQHG